MFIQVSDLFTIVLLALCVLPLMVLIIYAIVIRLVKISKKEKNTLTEVNDEQKTLFFNCYGGSENVTSVRLERTKLIVNVLDIDKTDANKLTELGAKGVLIVGNELRCSFGDRSTYIYEILGGK